MTGLSCSVAHSVLGAGERAEWGKCRFIATDIIMQYSIIILQKHVFLFFSLLCSSSVILCKIYWDVGLSFNISAQNRNYIYIYIYVSLVYATSFFTIYILCIRTKHLFYFIFFKQNVHFQTAFELDSSWVRECTQTHRK